MNTLEIIQIICAAIFGCGGLWSLLQNRQNIKAEEKKRLEERENDKMDRSEENKKLITQLTTHISSFEDNITSQLSNVEESVNKRIDVQEEMSIVNNDMTLALTRDKVLFLSKKYLEKGFIPEDEFETFISLGEAYLRAKGNSKVKKLFLQAKDLPIR